MRVLHLFAAKDFRVLKSRCQAKFLTCYSLSEGIKFADYFFDVCCVNLNFLV